MCNISTNKQQAIKHSVDYWMAHGLRLQLELDMYFEWYNRPAVHSDAEDRANLHERICSLMQFKYDANLEMQRQRDKITPHLQKRVTIWLQDGEDYYQVAGPFASIQEAEQFLATDASVHPGHLQDGNYTIDHPEHMN